MEYCSLCDGRYRKHCSYEITYFPLWEDSFTLIARIAHQETRSAVLGPRYGFGPAVEFTREVSGWVPVGPGRFS